MAKAKRYQTKTGLGRKAWAVKRDGRIGTPAAARSRGPHRAPRTAHCALRRYTGAAGEYHAFRQ